MLFRRISILLSVIAAFTIASCKEETGDDNYIDNAITIVRNGKSDYKALYTSTDQLQARKFTSAIWSKTGVSLDKAVIGKNVQEKEILLGNTGRPESSALLKEVGDYGYAIAVAGQKLVVVWTNVDYADEALERFTGDLLDKVEYCAKGRLQIPDDYKVVKKGEAPKFPRISDFLASRKPFAIKTELIGQVPADGDLKTAQGACSDGKYVYFVMRNGDDNQARIFKYNLDPFVFVGKSEIFNGGHCNDLAYCDPEKTVMVVHGSSQGKILTRVKAETLDVLGNMDIPVGSGALTYNKNRDRYCISQGGKTFYVATRSFTVELNKTRTDNTGYTAQGMGSDDSYVYFPMSGSSDNLLVTYDWNGNFVTNITVPIAKESESMFCVNDKYYVCFNNSKQAWLYRIWPEAN